MNERATNIVEEKLSQEPKKMKTPDDYTGYSTGVYAELQNLEKDKE